MNSPGGSGPPKLGLWPFVGAIFFMVSGGPYGLEEVIASHGYSRTLGLLLLVPLLWSLPIALLTSELAGLMPSAGGYFTWIRRGLGPFWAGLAAWLSLIALCCDMAIYPTLFVMYLSRLWPVFGQTALFSPGWALGVAMITACVGWNLLGSRRVGESSLALAAVLLSPFLLLCGGAVYQVITQGTAPFWQALLAPVPQPAANGNLGLWVDGVLLCMWNYNGWDNCSLLLHEVETPRRNYPRGLFLAMLFIGISYMLPTLAAAASGLAPTAWGTGSWVEVTRLLCGHKIAWLTSLGGALCGLGMFNALLLANARLPQLLSHLGVLPRILGKTSLKTGTPVVATIASAILYALCMGIQFQRLVEIDLLMFGCVLLLEFTAVLVLRVRCPSAPRPFQLPGGLLTAGLTALLPTLLLGRCIWVRRHRPMLLGLSALELSLALIALGIPIAWAISRRLRQVELGDPPLGALSSDVLPHVPPAP